jgi:hypothetical protein
MDYGLMGQKEEKTWYATKNGGLDCPSG